LLDEEQFVEKDVGLCLHPCRNKNEQEQTVDKLAHGLNWYLPARL
jgi:hypothetical protein